MSWRQNYEKNGYMVVANIASSTLCDLMIQSAQKKKQESGFNTSLKNGKGGQENNQKQEFRSGANKIGPFFQNTYINDPEIDVEAMVKIGHSVHTEKPFSIVTYSSKIKYVLSQLGMTDFVILQSMMLQKLPQRGGKITIHQDSTYLRAEPDTVLACWIPLQDVTTDNGCLWVIPGSHKSDLYYQLKIVDGFPRCQMNHPFDIKQTDWKPIQMNQGDLIILHGKLLHKSEQNLSKKSRHAYTWHLMDKKSKWLENNWLAEKQIKENQVRKE